MSRPITLQGGMTHTDIHALRATRNALFTILLQDKGALIAEITHSKRFDEELFWDLVEQTDDQLWAFMTTVIEGLTDGEWGKKGLEPNGDNNGQSSG
jgi:hypothetical protein